MRAKLKIKSITDITGGTQQVIFSAVGKSSPYDAEGNDEDNTFAKYTPTADLTMHISNPALIGTLKPNQVYYVDFTLAEDPGMAVDPTPSAYDVTDAGQGGQV